jgi:hypothetical protein
MEQEHNLTRNLAPGSPCVRVRRSAHSTGQSHAGALDAPVRTLRGIP